MIRTVTGPKMDRVLSSEVVALQLCDSISQHSRPGQPATPDQVLPFLNAASVHSSEAAALWRVDSRDMSASPAKPSQPAEKLPGPFLTPPSQAREPGLAREQQRAQSASQQRKRLADTCPETYTRETSCRDGQSPKRLSVATGASPRLELDTQDCQGGNPQLAGRPTKRLQASEHCAAQTEISQSAEDNMMHCCDSMASALAPLVYAHARSKPGLDAEVTDDSEDLSNSASDKALQLSLAELKAVFGVPLTEAAARLGVQRQDLVRSCRRHNLEGWPRLFISVTEAARSDASMPTSAPSDADASELAAFMPFGPSALRSAPLASQAHSVHTRSSSRVGGDRARASGASTRRKPASPQVEVHQQEHAAPNPSQQGSAKGGMLADPFPAAAVSLLSWSAAVGPGMQRASLLAAPLTLQVPAIQLDRPGMWAPKILQARARAQEATSMPREHDDRAGAAQPLAATIWPAAASLAAAPGHSSAALGAVSDQEARSSLGLKRVMEAPPEQASRAPADLSPQLKQAGDRPERQLESRTDTAHPPASSPEPEGDTASKLHTQAESADAAQSAPGGSPSSRQIQSQPARSAPLQGYRAPHSRGRRAADDARKTLSAPLILSTPDVPGEDDAATAAVRWAYSASKAETQCNAASEHIHAGSRAEHEAHTVNEHAPQNDQAPVVQGAAAAVADLMSSPFMQTLAVPEVGTPSAEVLGHVPVVASACGDGADSPSHPLETTRSLNRQSASADRCTKGSAELAMMTNRQLSKQSPALCLPPKKRLQKRRCGRGTPLPSTEEPTAGQAPHQGAKVSPCTEAGYPAAEPAMAFTPVKGSPEDVAEKTASAEQRPKDAGQVIEDQPAAADQVPLTDAPVAAAKRLKRPGRPPGSGKAAREKALGMVLPACSPEGKRPLKKSRKALEAEQAEEALLNLRKEQPCLSEGEHAGQDKSKAPGAKKGRSSSSADRQQPEQAGARGREEQAHASKIQLMPQTPTSRPRSVFLGTLKLPRPDLGKIGEDMECSEKLPGHVPDAIDNCLNLSLNLSPPPALPGTTFGGSICNSLLGSPLPRMDCPDYHEIFYGGALNDLSLGNFNDIADSSFSFGCFNN